MMNDSAGCISKLLTDNDSGNHQLREEHIDVSLRRVADYQPRYNWDNVDGN